MKHAEAVDTIANTLLEDGETRAAWVEATAGVLCDHSTDTPEQRREAAKAVLSLLFFGSKPNPWQAMPGVVNGDALAHVVEMY